MTDEEQLTFLLKVLKQYAEREHCYDREGDDYTSSKYTHCDDAFDDGSDFSVDDMWWFWEYLNNLGGVNDD